MDMPARSETTAARLRVVSAIAMPGLDTSLVVADGVGPAVEPDGDRVGWAFEVGAWEQLAGMGDQAMTDGKLLEVHTAAT